MFIIIQKVNLLVQKWWQRHDFQGLTVQVDVVNVRGNPKIFLVVGECGDGKSTLINALRDPQRSGEPKSGLSSRGVTKSIEAYVSWWRFPNDE